jgi:hypothetical protein
MTAQAYMSKLAQALFVAKQNNLQTMLRAIAADIIAGTYRGNV